MPFDNRTSAGLKLYKYLEKKTDIGTVVVPHLQAYSVAKPIVSRFNSNTVLRLSDYISCPDRPSIDFGAVVEDRTIWIDDKLREELDVSSDHIEKTAWEKSRGLRAKSSRISERPLEEWIDGSILIVSDGISSGFREAAVAGSLKKKGAEKISVAAPAVSRNRVADFGSLVENIFYLDQPAFLNSPEDCYIDNKLMKNSQKL